VMPTNRVKLSHCEGAFSAATLGAARGTFTASV
jgi:hypothetical protein